RDPRAGPVAFDNGQQRGGIARGGRDIEPGAFQQLGQAREQQHRVLADHHPEPAVPGRRRVACHGFHATATPPPGAVARNSGSGVQPASPPIVNPAGWSGPALAPTVDAMVTTVAPRSGAPARRYRGVRGSRHAWGQAVYRAGGIPAQVAAPLIVLGPAFAVKPRWVLPLAGLVVAGLVVMFLAVPMLTQVQRHRLRATAGVAIPPQPAMERRLRWSAIAAAARSAATWRQMGYHLLAGPALAGAAAAAVAMWLAGILYTLVYAYAWALPPDGLLYRGRP